MSRIPKMPKLPANMQQPVCEVCFGRGGPVRYMEVLVGRSFDEEYGTMQHRCRTCGHVTDPVPVPLYVLAASNLDQLGQILAVSEFAESNGVSDLSPGAKMIAEQYGMNPYLLAEAASAFAVKWQLAEEQIAGLNERLAAGEE